MEAITKSGKKIHGRIAEILVKKGSATPFEETEVKPDEKLPGKPSEEPNYASEQADADRVAEEEVKRVERKRRTKKAK